MGARATFHSLARKSAQALRRSTAFGVKLFVSINIVKLTNFYTRVQIALLSVLAWLQNLSLFESMFLILYFSETSSLEAFYSVGSLHSLCRVAERAVLNGAPGTKEGSVTPEERIPLCKTAADPNGRIAIRQSHRVAWHANWERWEVFARCERLQSGRKKWARISEGCSPSGRSRLAGEPSPKGPVWPAQKPDPSLERSRFGDAEASRPNQGRHERRMGVTGRTTLNARRQPPRSAAPHCTGCAA